MCSYNISYYYTQPYTGGSSDGSFSNGGSSNGGENGEGRNGGGSEGEGNGTGNGEKGGDKINGSCETPTEGIILIVFVLLMMCL